MFNGYLRLKARNSWSFHFKVETYKISSFYCFPHIALDHSNYKVSCLSVQAKFCKNITIHLFCEVLMFMFNYLDYACYRNSSYHSLAFHLCYFKYIHSVTLTHTHTYTHDFPTLATWRWQCRIDLNLFTEIPIS